MTKKTIPQQVEAKARQLRSMRQFRDALAAGRMTEDQLMLLAMERVAGYNAAHDDSDPAPGRELFGSYSRPPSARIFEDPWFVGDSNEADEIVAAEGELGRTYFVYAERAAGRVRRLVFDMHYEPDPSILALG